jgi:hypothetical protein
VITLHLAGLRGTCTSAAPRLRHVEWFHDHVRIEHMLYDGVPVPKGMIRPDLSRPGHSPERRHKKDAAASNNCHQCR